MFRPHNDVGLTFLLIYTHWFVVVEIGPAASTIWFLRLVASVWLASILTR